MPLSSNLFTRNWGIGEMSEKLANPAPLGLLGFGMTTVLLNLHNASFYGLHSMILTMGLFYGGLAQVIAGLFEFKKGNTFGMVAFTSYGLFWWSLVSTILLPELFPNVVFPALHSGGLAAFFFMWGIFTFVMFFGTLKSSRALQFVFMSLAILFFLLTASELTNLNADVLHVTGYEGIICGLSAVYLGLAEVINEAHGKILPIGQIKQE